MKNYIIGILLICILVMSSFVYKNSKGSILVKFPIENKKLDHDVDKPPFFIYVFFSKYNCHNCLEVISVLNELPSQFIVTGIVPKKEFEKEAELREITGAYFKLISFKESYRKFIPHYTPTIFGVGGNGKIYFMIPGISVENEYMKNFLIDFYSNSLHLLLKDKKKE